METADQELEYEEHAVPFYRNHIVVTTAEARRDIDQYERQQQQQQRPAKNVKMRAQEYDDQMNPRRVPNYSPGAFSYIQPYPRSPPKVEPLFQENLFKFDEVAIQQQTRRMVEESNIKHDSGFIETSASRQVQLKHRRLSSSSSSLASNQQPLDVNKLENHALYNRNQLGLIDEELVQYSCKKRRTVLFFLLIIQLNLSAAIAGACGYYGGYAMASYDQAFGVWPAFVTGPLNTAMFAVSGCILTVFAAIFGILGLSRPRFSLLLTYIIMILIALLMIIEAIILELQYLIQNYDYVYHTANNYNLSLGLTIGLGAFFLLLTAACLSLAISIIEFNKLPTNAESRKQIGMCNIIMAILYFIVCSITVAASALAYSYSDTYASSAAGNYSLSIYDVWNRLSIRAIVVAAVTLPAVVALNIEYFLKMRTTLVAATIAALVPLFNLFLFEITDIPTLLYRLAASGNPYGYFWSPYLLASASTVLIIIGVVQWPFSFIALFD